MAGTGRVRRSRRLRETTQPGVPAAPGSAPGAAPEDWRDWGGLPVEVLANVAEKYAAHADKRWARGMKRGSFPLMCSKAVKRHFPTRTARGAFLLPFALVCKTWRKAQLKVGKMCTTISDVVLSTCSARDGGTRLMKFMRDQGLPLNADVMKYAAWGGDLKLVQWLRRKRCAWDGQACAYAAGRGHLKVLEWLRANGCPWDRSTTKSAVLNGHVEVLRWARENGCDWDGYRYAENAYNKFGYVDHDPEWDPVMLKIARREERELRWAQGDFSDADDYFY